MEELCLFTFGGNSTDEIIQQLLVFKNTNFAQTNFQQAARFQYRRWLKNCPHAFSACILGSTPEELLREIEYALTGIPEAAGKSSDWRTPAGSTFSPNPLGNSGSIAFVYPGAFNSYIGVGQDLFRLFPPLYQRLTDISTHIGDLLNERQLYPRRFAPILPEDQEQLEKQLVADPLAMLISGTCLAAVYTFLLRETFDIHPASSLGYSLGEISMMFSSGVWTKADETALALRQSPLFHNRLAGNQDAVREYWRKSGSLPESADGRLWANFILMASYEKVAEALKSFPHVYVTHINTPRQVVIGGQPDECRQLIASLKCSSLEAPFNYALHCAAMESEFEALQELHTWPVQNQPGMTLYSADTDGPMPIEQYAIARQIAHGLCHRLDFPRLVETAYAGGARIFIELGAGSNCTRWVDESLAGKPHSAFSINRKGVDDHSAILQMLARLITHGVPVNLSPIFG
jgi:PfaB family protein